MTDRLYFTDPLLLEFTAQVTDVLPAAGGRFNAILPATYFYPTGGGQDHDSGWIGDARVMDVFTDEQDLILHTLDREIKPGNYAARIDKDRRLGNMKSHSAQHILSWAFVKVLEKDTLSSHINWEKPSSIDLDGREIQMDELVRVEDLANVVIQEDREVKTYFINESQIPSVQFRRAPKVTGTVRVVEVDGCDYSACGGTHVPRTGMIGLVKVIKTEIQNQKLRVHFVCGDLAVRQFQNSLEVVRSLTQMTGSNINDLVSIIRHKLEQYALIQEELEISQSELLLYEASEMKNRVVLLSGCRTIIQVFQDRGVDHLRRLVNHLRSHPGYIIILGTIHEDKLSLVAGRSNDIPQQADKILGSILDKCGGKGGGDAALAQGGCPSDGFDPAHWNELLHNDLARYLAEVN